MIKHALRIRRHIATAVSVTFLTFALAPAAHASGSSMPWEAPLQSILESIEGPVHRVRRIELLPVVLLLRWRSARLMAEGADHGGEVPGFSVPVHRALTEHILLGGAPRSLAILNGTLAAALGLGLRLWLVGLGLWAVGHFAAVWAAKRDPQFVDVVRKHLRIPGHLSV